MPALHHIALPCILALLAATGLSHAQNIKRWVDERGVVHYGDATPARGATQVTHVPPVPALSAEEKARANAQMAQYREALAPAAASSDPATAAATTASQAKGPDSSDQSCLAQWQRYNAAYACMDGGRIKGGGVRPEVYARCPVVPQPNCRPPAGVMPP